MFDITDVLVLVIVLPEYLDCFIAFVDPKLNKKIAFHWNNEGSVGSEDCIQ
jgi:hypothetical protein